MSRITQPTYRYETDTWLGGAWNTKTNGRPTRENLDRYIRAMVASGEPGGYNEQVEMPRPTWGRIVHQTTGKVVANWEG